MSCSAIKSAVDRLALIAKSSNLRLTAHADSLCIAATNLETEAMLYIPSSVASSFALCIDCKSLSAGLPTFSAETTLVPGEGTIRIGESIFETFPADDFPQLMLSECFSSSIPLPDFSRVSIAMSTEKARHYLNGICALSIDGRLSLVATDGYRLSWDRLDIPFDCPPSIMPRTFISLLPKFIKKDKAAISFSSKGVRIDLSDGFIAAKLIDGEYPDFQRVVPSPKDAQNIITLSTSALIPMVKSIKQSVGKDASLALVFDDTSLRIEAGDLRFPAIPLGSDQFFDFKIGFNSRYLLDFLYLFPSLTFHFFDPERPVLLSSPDCPQWSGVLVPRRV